MTQRLRGALLLGSVLFAGGLCLFTPRLHAAENLVPEGTFQNKDAAGKPANWEMMNPEGLNVAAEDGDPFLRIVNGDNAKAVGIQKTVKLPAGSKLAVVSARMRTAHFALGKEGWHEARIALRFENDKGEMAGGYPSMPNLRTNSDWVTRQVVLDVPDGATRLVMQPGLWLATGTLDLDDIRVEAYGSGREYLRERARPLRENFPEGTFEQAEGGGNAPVGWSVPSARQFQVVESGGAKVLRISNPQPDADLYATGLFEIDPKWATLDFALRARVADFAPGTYGWKQARILATFLDENNKQIAETTLASLGGNQEWKQHTARADVPENARYLRLAAGWERAAGVLEIDDLALKPAGEAPLANAELPPGQKLGWGEEKAETISTKRARMSLNGIWRFIPAEGPAARDPKAGWGFIRVPGSWKNNDHLLARGQGRIWQNFNGDRLAQAWYERTIKVPAEWAGRAVLLDLRRVSTDAVVYIDGKEIGSVNWPGGTVDITDAVTPGREATLRLRVIATDDRAQVSIYMGYLQNEMRPANLDNRGVIATSPSSAARRAPTSTTCSCAPRRGRRSSTSTLNWPGSPPPGICKLTARLLDEQGKVEKTFTQTLPAKASGMQTATASWDWADPRLWDVGKPNLYTLQLDVSGAGVDDQYVQEFGFREFWIEGKKFFLNNTEFRLRPGNIQYGVTASKWLNAATTSAKSGRKTAPAGEPQTTTCAWSPRPTASGCPSAATCCSWPTG
jgi:hypothetical protein